MFYTTDHHVWATARPMPFCLDAAGARLGAVRCDIAYLGTAWSPWPGDEQVQS